MSRIPRLVPAQLDQAQRDLHEAIAGGPRARSGAFRLVDDDGRLEGPFNAMLLHPPLGDALQRLGAAIRYRGALSDRAREIAILAVAAHWQSGFEQYAHERIAREIGLADEEIAALRCGDLQPVVPEEKAVAAATRHILDHHTLSDTAYAEAVGELGAARVFELTALIGYYELLAMLMRVFGVEGPER